MTWRVAGQGAFVILVYQLGLANPTTVGTKSVFALRCV
jgi:hypothetical protein